LEPIDYSLITHKADIYPDFVHAYGIGKDFYSTVLAYNSGKFPKGKEPQSWKDFWDVKKYPGPRALENTPYNNLEIALVADGVPRESLYPLDMDRAFRSLDRIKPYITVWWKSGAQPAQLLTDKEVDMTSIWNGRAFAIQQAGAKVGVQWNEGVFMGTGWVIPKGCKNKELALKLVDFTLDPKRQARNSEILGYPMANQKLFDYIEPEIGPYLPTYPQHFQKRIHVNDLWWIENRIAAQDRWNEWMLK
jgi:putative spermidine/putrescine transport system substrate-binding protein